MTYGILCEQRKKVNGTYLLFQQLSSPNKHWDEFLPSSQSQISVILHFHFRPRDLSNFWIAESPHRIILQNHFFSAFVYFSSDSFSSFNFLFFSFAAACVENGLWNPSWSF
mmetsp:Transcript_9944/g.23573  ORF Transcript_9944/g.23573 Transcript_9944/m.23573 type:complete len:111 (+) Transcript_9944:8010-8342(+)